MAGLVAGGLAGVSLSSCGRFARTRRTVRHSHIQTTRNIAESCFPVRWTADGLPFTRGWSAVHFQIPLRNGVFLEPNLPLYGGRSAVQYRTVRSTFLDNYTEPNLFWNPSRISPADGPGLKGGQFAVTVALRSNSPISFSVLMHLHVSSCIIHTKLHIAQNNVK